VRRIRSSACEPNIRSGARRARSMRLRWPRRIETTRAPLTSRTRAPRPVPGNLTGSLNLMTSDDPREPPAPSTARALSITGRARSRGLIRHSVRPAPRASETTGRKLVSGLPASSRRTVAPARPGPTRRQRTPRIRWPRTAKRRPPPARVGSSTRTASTRPSASRSSVRATPDARGPGAAFAPTAEAVVPGRTKPAPLAIAHTARMARRLPVQYTQSVSTDVPATSAG
jgi:hypothetical protein